MAFDITFDFRFDSSDFFTEPVRAALEAAAGLWEDVIQDEFPDVPAGVAFSVNDPSGGGTRQVVLDQPIDDLRVFVGASSPPFGDSGSPDVLARGGPSGFDVQGDAFTTRFANNFRGTGPVTDFEPFAGQISFDPTQEWSFALDDPAPEANDLVSVAAHEIGHILGIGTSGAFSDRISGLSFDGPNARAVNGGAPLPLAGDLAHIADGFADDSTLMDPSLTTGTRLTPSDPDLALLADIGFEIDGFEAQGETPPIATDEGETIFGTVVADTIDGGGGNDQIQGNAGDDTLRGGAGMDTLFGSDGDDLVLGGAGMDELQGGAGTDLLDGGAGSDTLFGGPGEDLLDGGAGDDEIFGRPGRDTVFMAPGGGVDRFNDFMPGTDRVRIDPGFGFADAEAVLATLARPFLNVSRLQLDAETALDLFHDNTDSSPLTAADITVGPRLDIALPTVPSAPNLSLVLGATTPEVLPVPEGIFAELLGPTAERTIRLDAGAAATGLDAGSTVDLDIPAEAATLVRNGTTLEVRDDTGALLTRLAAGTEEGTLRFTDAGGSVSVANGAIRVAGTAFAEDDESRPAAALDLDPALAAGAGAEGPATPTPAGNTPNIGVILRADTPASLGVATGFNAEVFGNSGDKIVDLADGAAVRGLDAGTTVRLAAQSDGFTFVRNGTTLEARDADGLTVISLAAGGDNGLVQFLDVGGTLQVADGGLAFGGESFADGESLAAAELDLAPNQSIAALPALTADDDLLG